MKYFPFILGFSTAIVLEVVGFRITMWQWWVLMIWITFAGAAYRFSK